MFETPARIGTKIMDGIETVIHLIAVFSGAPSKFLDDAKPVKVPEYTGARSADPLD
jgi:hypothetical protein